MTTESKGIEGHVEVCAHRVFYWYDLEDMDGVEDVEDYAAILEQEAEERAKAMITDGCISGELCCVLVDGQEEYEVFGWWNIDRS